MGAGGRDFHNFNVIFRGDSHTQVVAFTASQIPDIDDRLYPPSLAGPLYPDGIRVRPEGELDALIRSESIDEVVFAYSDIAHVDVMHKASLVLAAGADFTLIGPRRSMLTSSKPVIAVCASRTGAGKSQTSRYVARLLMDAGLNVVLVRHPMPYGDLEKMRAQRFADLSDIDAASPTVEEREEYEVPVRLGMVVMAGVDYAEVLKMAESEADVIIWDGGNNDFPFVAPDILITVVDPLRPGHERSFHPGETNVRMADIVLVNKLDSAEAEAVDEVMANLAVLNPTATIVKAVSPVNLESGPSLEGKRVLVIEDGPTVTHGGAAAGAGTIAALRSGAAELIDPRPFAVGSIAEVFAKYPSIGPVLPAMGYGTSQLEDLGATVRAVDCDAVVVGTPVDLGRLIDLGHPSRRVRYEFGDAGAPTLAAVLGPSIEKWCRGER